jgi:hypothetical protein
MAMRIINIGNRSNDGSGDDLRTAFQKVNENFYDIQLQGGQANTISNIGLGVPLYKEKIGVDLRLKTLTAGPGISITGNPNDVLISNTYNMIVTVNSQNGSLTALTPTQSLNIVGDRGITTSITDNTLTISDTKNMITTVRGDTGILVASSQTQSISFVGGTGITTSINGTTLTITGNDYTLSNDTNPTLAGNLNLNGFDIIGDSSSNVTANAFYGNFIGDVIGNLTGNVTGLVYDHDIRQIHDTLYTFDFGLISGVVYTPAQLFLLLTVIDMGTMYSPAEFTIDGGPLADGPVIL